MQALLYADVLCGAILNGLLVKLFWLKRKNVDQLELILAIISSDAKWILFKRYFELYKHLFWRYSKMYGKNASLHHGSFKICLRIILVLDRCEWTVKHITLSPSLDKGSCFTWQFHDQFSLFTSKKDPYIHQNFPNLICSMHQPNRAFWTKHCICAFFATDTKCH